MIYLNRFSNSNISCCYNAVNLFGVSLNNIDFYYTVFATTSTVFTVLTSFLISLSGLSFSINKIPSSAN